MSDRKSYIGTNFGHSSSSCLVSNEGVLEFAVEEDRLIKEKHTAKFPLQGLEIISGCNLLENDIVYAEGWHLNKRLIKKGILHTLKYWDDPNYYRFRFKNEWRRFNEGKKLYAGFGRFHFCGHHLAHAYSLLPCGLPKNSLIFVSDTIGESESISFFYWDGAMRRVRVIPYPHSPGSVFHQFAWHLGFSGRTGPGKLMALSGYGEPVWVDDLEGFSRVGNGNLKIDLAHYPAQRLKDAPDRFILKNPELPFARELALCKNNYAAGLNIAASVQKWFAENSWKLLSQNIDYVRNKLRLPVDHVGLAGGAALNCQANGMFLRRLPAHAVSGMTVSPWSDDSGASVGAAMWAFVKNNPGITIPKAGAFLGPPAFSSHPFVAPADEALAVAAKAILGGALVALVSGRMEFGPRALGGRCILADAFEKSSVQKLNSCKSRPDFMPFAPAVLEEDFEALFQGIGSEHMAWTVKATDNAKLLAPAAVHVTGEARVQVVVPENKLLYNLLKQIKRLRGIGVVLLTSLNAAGKTIPVDYEDALATSAELGLEGILSDSGWASPLMIKNNLNRRD